MNLKQRWLFHMKKLTLLLFVDIKTIFIYVELTNPIESAVALNNERVVIRGMDCERLALWRPLCRACARV